MFYVTFSLGKVRYGVTPRMSLSDSLRSVCFDLKTTVAPTEIGHMERGRLFRCHRRLVSDPRLLTYTHFVSHMGSLVTSTSIKVESWLYGLFGRLLFVP